MSDASLKVKRLVPEAFLPIRGSECAAGADLFSSVDCLIPARGRALVETGISVIVPPGTYGRIGLPIITQPFEFCEAPRSGLSATNGLDVGAGVVDADYRGEVKVLLFNHSDQDYQVRRGHRIAQLICERCAVVPIEEITDLCSRQCTQRGTQGFGSTGT